MPDDLLHWLDTVDARHDASPPGSLSTQPVATRWLSPGSTNIEGEWAGRVTGLADQRVEIAMMRTPDGHSRLELSRFLTPPVVADHRNAPVNALGYLRVMFAVDNIDETLDRLRKRGAQLVGEVVQYQDSYRLCYIRGPEGLLIGLAQELN